MAIIHVIAFVLTALAAGYLLEVSLSDMLPLVWCGLSLILYGLAFAGKLSLIDIIFPIAAAVLAAAAFYYSCGRNTRFISYASANLLSAPFILYVLISVCIMLGLSAKTVTWWDDINFWASDARSLYFMDGFAGKYANVSPGFGDYPPGIQVIKWYALHMDGNEYREGLAFIGYNLFNMSFLMPLFKRIRRQQMWLVLPLVPAVWLFQGIFDKYGYAGFCADLSMAFLFGSVLIASADTADKKSLFKFLRMSLLLGVLVLTKSMGAVWALFGFIIYCIFRIKDDNNVTHVTTKLMRALSVLAVPFTVGMAWVAFCLVNHRVTKTTATAITYITTDRYGLSEYTSDFAVSFIKGFLTEPLHVDHTWVDFSAAVIFAFTVAGLIAVGHIYGSRVKGIRTACHVLPFMGIIYYLFIFAAHITIFATETQYLEPSAMAASIERYGLPYMVGSTMFILWSFLNAERYCGGETGEEASDRRTVAVTMIFALMTVILSDIPAAYEAIVGYRYHAEENVRTRNECITEESAEFINDLQNAFPGGNVRVCRIHDGSYTVVPDAYVAYEASPVSVMTVSFELDKISQDVLTSAVSETHSGFIYADRQDSVPAWLDDMCAEGDFEFDTVYRIAYEDGAAVLYRQ